MHDSYEGAEDLQHVSELSAIDFARHQVRRVKVGSIHTHLALISALALSLDLTHFLGLCRCLASHCSNRLRPCTHSNRRPSISTRRRSRPA